MLRAKRNRVDVWKVARKRKAEVETRSTFTLRRGFPYIDSILFLRVKFTWVRRKNYATVEIHLFSQMHGQEKLIRYYLYPVNKCCQTGRRVLRLKFTRSCHWFLLEWCCSCSKWSDSGWLHSVYQSFIISWRNGKGSGTTLWWFVQFYLC